MWIQIQQSWLIRVLTGFCVSRSDSSARFEGQLLKTLIRELHRNKVLVASAVSRNIHLLNPQTKQSTMANSHFFHLEWSLHHVLQTIHVESGCTRIALQVCVQGWRRPLVELSLLQRPHSLQQVHSRVQLWRGELPRVIRGL